MIRLRKHENGAGGGVQRAGTAHSGAADFWRTAQSAGGWALLCTGAAALNAALSFFSQEVLKLSLFLDTLFTIAVTFYGGLPAGVITGLLTNLIIHTLDYKSLFLFSYALCSVAAALVTALWMRLFPLEFQPLNRKSRVIPVQKSFDAVKFLRVITALMLLSLTLCLLISFLGGFIGMIGVLLQLENPDVTRIARIVFIRHALIHKELPLFLVETLTRLPVNIIDRLISVFGAYAAAALLAKRARRGRIPARGARVKRGAGKSAPPSKKVVR